MDRVVIRDLVVGEGRPKICLPIVGADQECILQEAEHIRKSKLADLVEWRADFYDEMFDSGGRIDEAAVLQMLKSLRDTLGKIPLLFTFRTKKEGGEREIHQLYYECLLELAASSGYVDLIDVEALSNEQVSEKIIKRIHSHGVNVIASNHDFTKTPSKDEIKSRLLHMQELGADVCKLAAMPQNRDDVLTLLNATYELNRDGIRKPIVTMSMGGEGSISRLTGEFFGSAITFGCLKEASAPGQIDAFKLQAVLQIMHDGLDG
jgi:3-dehydroquinate dehydratase-1